MFHVRREPSGCETKPPSRRRKFHASTEAKSLHRWVARHTVVALSLAATGPAQAWTHPGIVVSQGQLDATRSAYQAGNPVIVDQVNKAKNSNYGSLSYSVKGPWPGGINQCGSNSNPNKGCQQADDDSNAAYVPGFIVGT